MVARAAGKATPNLAMLHSRDFPVGLDAAPILWLQ
jgi:hypothetical protein